jgi:O6-methylguanine-DNA--protein-cysteine methyltransferase
VVIIVPCHRIVPASGGIGNYGSGPERKRKLLTIEDAEVVRGS